MGANQGEDVLKNTHNLKVDIGMHHSVSERKGGLSMLINSKSLLIVALFLNCVVPVFPSQPSGGVLSLDGVDDYAILPFEEHGYLFPENTREFTVEMWFYPKSGPNHGGGSDIILSQQVYFGVALNHQRCRDDGGKLCWHVQAYMDSEDGHGLVFFYVPMEINRWNYAAIIFKDRTLGRAYNNRIYQIGPTVLDRVSAEVDERPKDFFVGGYAQAFFPFRGAPPTTGFHGDIDTIRFSRVARYDLPKVPGIEAAFDPPHRFVRDRDTIALWNFDEREGETRFEDESKNKRVLIGMNGASIGSALDVNPESTSLTTTWGRIKARSR